MSVTNFLSPFSLPHIPEPLATLKENKAFENIVGKGENDVNQLWNIYTLFLVQRKFSPDLIRNKYIQLLFSSTHLVYLIIVSATNVLLDLYGIFLE